MGLTAFYSFCAYLGFILKVHVNLVFYSILASPRYISNDSTSQEQLILEDTLDRGVPGTSWLTSRCREHPS